MPNQLSPEKVRVTYAEFPDVAKRLNEEAKAKRKALSDILRANTERFVEQHKAGKWKAKPYAGPARPGLIRITYAEWRDRNDYLAQVMKDERIDRADLLRSIMQTYSAR